MGQISSKSCRRRFHIVAIADGVGSLHGSGEVAEAAIGSSLQAANEFLQSRASGRPLGEDDAERLCANLAEALGKLGGTPSQATTLSLAIVGARSAVIVWAGDSRIYAIARSGLMEQLTTDHQDSEGRIERYISGDGKVIGRLQTRTVDVEHTACLLFTTDGVHESCDSEELRHLALYAMSENVAKTDRLPDILSTFLEHSISDNATLGLVYRPLPLRRLLRMAHRATGANEGH